MVSLELIKKYNEDIAYITCPYCMTYHTRYWWSRNTSKHYNGGIEPLGQHTSDCWFYCPNCKGLAYADKGILYTHHDYLKLYS